MIYNSLNKEEKTLLAIRLKHDLTYKRISLNYMWSNINTDIIKNAVKYGKK